MAKIVSRGNVTVEFTTEEVEFLERLLGHHIFGFGELKTVSDGIYLAITGDGESRKLPTDDSDCIYLIEGE